MTLEQLIKSYSWLSVKLTLEKLFPEQDNYIVDYEKMFESLKLLPATESNITIDVDWVHDDYDNTNYVDVSGYYTEPALRTNEYSNSLAIEFVSWNEWLGMSLDENSLQNFNELEIIAYCISEMSFVGFDQEKIQSEMDRIQQISEDYKNMSPEEKKKNSYSLEELKEKLNKTDKDDKLVED